MVYSVGRHDVYSVTSLRHQYEVIIVTVTYSDVIDKGAWQTVYAMLRQFSVTFQTEILSTEISSVSKTHFLCSLLPEDLSSEFILGPIKASTCMIRKQGFTI